MGAELGGHGTLRPNTAGRRRQLALCRGVDPAQGPVLRALGHRSAAAAAAELSGGRATSKERNPADGRRRWDCTWPTSRTARKSASSPTRTTPASCANSPGAADTAGDIVTTDGTVVGRHEGLEHFTIGQRKGLGMRFGQPRYVVRIEAATRRVVVGTREELARDELTASGANWFLRAMTPSGPAHRL